MNPTATPPRDDRWILRARELLQQEAARPDPTLQRRLAQLRANALAPRRRTPPLLGWGLAVGALSALLVMGVGIWQQLLPAAGPLVPVLEQPALRAESPLEQVLTLPEEDLALLAASDDFALLQELEFYVWLEGAENGG